MIHIVTLVIEDIFCIIHTRKWPLKYFHQPVTTLLNLAIDHKFTDELDNLKHCCRKYEGGGGKLKIASGKRKKFKLCINIFLVMQSTTILIVNIYLYGSRKFSLKFS